MTTWYHCISFRTLHRDLTILNFLLAAKLELTSNTEPYEPVPSVFPVGTTWSKKYCCNLESLLKVLDQPCLLAMVSSSLKPCYRATPERSHCIRRYPRLKWETRRTILGAFVLLLRSLPLHNQKYHLILYFKQSWYFMILIQSLAKDIDTVRLGNALYQVLAVNIE